MAKRARELQFLAILILIDDKWRVIFWSQKETRRGKKETPWRWWLIALALNQLGNWLDNLLQTTEELADKHSTLESGKGSTHVICNTRHSLIGGALANGRLAPATISYARSEQFRHMIVVQIIGNPLFACTRLLCNIQIAFVYIWKQFAKIILCKLKKI